MFNFLHTFHPDPIFLSLGPISIHWYGLLIISGIIAAGAIAIKLGKYYHLSSEQILDLSFYLVIFGILGARIYDCILEYQYYLVNPWNVFKIWQGGLAIHGAIIAGIIVVYAFAKKFKTTFWTLSSIVVPGLSLALGIGRWGNYFNQELFGRPTNLPWGIPIDIYHRPIDYINFQYFHPTFLYESLGSLAICLFLLSLHDRFIKKYHAAANILAKYHYIITVSYLLLYSVLRFSVETIRIDWAPTLLWWRTPQTVSILIFVLALGIILKKSLIKKS